MITMRTYTALFILMILFTSCDDGDIIITTFEFEEENFQMCSSGTSKVLYHIANEDVFETLTVSISNNALSPEDGRLIRSLETLSLPLSQNEIAPIRINTSAGDIVYRTYDGPVPADYFCSEIPPSTPHVLQEYQSVGGEIVINTSIGYNRSNNILDHDGDGVPSSEEGMDTLQDTDGDGIPDYLDVDDDGDNVLTSTEIRVQVSDPTEDEYPDTDEDGIPNYLDPDDDGDGVPTRREITEEIQDPTRVLNEAGTTPRYLDEFVSIRYDGEIEFSIPNEINLNYNSIIEVRNLKLRNQGGDGEEISFTEKSLGVFSSSNVNTLITVNGNGEEIPDEEEEEENPGEEEEENPGEG